MKLIRNRNTLWLFFAAVIIYACSVTTSDGVQTSRGDGVVLPNGTVFTRTALLEAFGACIFSEIELFEQEALVFSQIADDALNRPSATSVEMLRTAWSGVIDIWQRLEMMQVGPAARRTKPGGRDLRSVIYPYPQSDYCTIDQNLVFQRYQDDGSQIARESNNLWAAEYLLFAADGTNACPSSDAINLEGGWDGLTNEELVSRRLAYVALVARTVANAAQALRESWSPSGDNFMLELSAAGEGSRTYGKKRVGINE